MSTKAETYDDIIIRTRMFRYHSPNGPSEALELLPEGKVGLGTQSNIDYWGTSYNSSLERHQLILHSSGKLLATLVLQNDGTWKGRERESNKNVSIEPMREVPKPTPKYDLGPQIDWTRYEFDLSKYVPICRAKDQTTAIAIIGCDRLSYFRRVVKSVAQNPESAIFPIFVFLDRPESGEDLQNDHMKVVKELLPHCTIVKRPTNFGCGRNLIDVRRQLFDNLGFTNVFIFEDDLILSPTYIKFCLNLRDWANENYSNIGSVQGWNRCTLGKDDSNKASKLIDATYSNWWGYLLNKSVWDSIKDKMYLYEKMFLGGDYVARPHQSIYKWFDDQLGNASCPVGRRSFSISQELHDSRERYFNEPPTGQDAATMILFHAAGWHRICPIVSRSQYIGTSGIHMNPKQWIQSGYGQLSYWPRAEDNKRIEFEAYKGQKLEEPPTETMPGLTFFDRRS